MIAKITRGTRPGDIAAYLHGPGRANEHSWTDELGDQHPGGIVIASTVFREGDTRGADWAKLLRESASTRPEIRKPIWHVSLRNRPDDRSLSDAEWAAAAQSFAEQMGFAEHPWVAVRHGEDHIHLVTSRVRPDGEVWHARGDYRAAQKAATVLEQEHGLKSAPRSSTTKRQSQRTVNATHRRSEVQIHAQRESIRDARKAVAVASEGINPRGDRAAVLGGPRRVTSPDQPRQRERGR